MSEDTNTETNTPDETEPTWSVGLNTTMDDAFNVACDEVEKTGAVPVAVCVFVLHENGTLTIATGGEDSPASSNLALALVCDAVRRELAERARINKVNELADFASDLLLASR